MGAVPREAGLPLNQVHLSREAVAVLTITQVGGGVTIDLTQPFQIGQWDKDETYGTYGSEATLDEGDPEDGGDDLYYHEAYDSNYTPDETQIYSGVRQMLTANAQSPSNVVSYLDNPYRVTLTYEDMATAYNVIEDEAHPYGYWEDLEDTLHDQGKLDEDASWYDTLDLEDNLMFSTVLGTDGMPVKDSNFIQFLFEGLISGCYGFLKGDPRMEILVEDTQTHVGLFKISEISGRSLTKPVYFVGKTDKVTRLGQTVTIAQFADHSQDGAITDGTYGKYKYDANCGYAEGYTPNESQIVQTVLGILNSNAESPSDVVSHVNDPVDVCLSSNAYSLYVYNGGYDGEYSDTFRGNDEYIYDYENHLCFSPVITTDGNPLPDHDFVGFIAHFCAGTGDDASFLLAYNTLYGEPPALGTMSLLLEDTERGVGLFRMNKYVDSNGSAVNLTKPVYFVGKTYDFDGDHPTIHRYNED